MYARVYPFAQRMLCDKQLKVMMGCAANFELAIPSTL
jgi:hypothetical protein